MSSRRVRIWDVAQQFTKESLVSVVTNAVIALDLTHEEENKSGQHISHSEDKSLFCTSCQVSIPDTTHYKSSWHVLNTKLRAVGAKPVTQNDFEHLELETDLGDEEDLIEELASQASSSAPSSSLDVQAQTGSARITFVTKDHTTLSVWKSVLLAGKGGTIAQYAAGALSLSDKIDPSFANTTQKANSRTENAKNENSEKPSLTVIEISKLPRHPFQWTIFLCQGGYFAGAVFRGDEVLKHKRIARYTVRRKQGGAQASKDQVKGGIHSAGASIRRYNETRLREEIAELMKNWKIELQQSSCVFLHAPSYNSASFFYEGSPISRGDSRVRSIPIVTDRPSFVELQRIHLILSTVETATFDGVDNLRSSLENMVMSSGAENGEKSQTGSSAAQTEASSMRSSSSSFFSLTEGEYSNFASEDVLAQVKSGSKISTSRVSIEEDLISKAIDSGNVEEVRRLLIEEEYVYQIPEKAEDMVWPLMRAVQLPGKLNMALITCLIECGESLDARSPKYGLKTVLHVACEKGEDSLVELLLEEGANPTILDLYNHTAYDTCREKSTRTLMRKFAGANEGLWEWTLKARVPLLTDEMEELAKAKEAEKRKRKKAAQKERKKAQKVEEEEIKAENEKLAKAEEELEIARNAAYERTKRILNMSDREKRALAAERRMKGGAPECDNCGKEIKIEPFERYSFKYCSSECVVEHKRVLDTLQSTSGK